MHLIPRPDEIGLTLPYNLIPEAQTSFIDEPWKGMTDGDRDDRLMLDIYDTAPKWLGSFGEVADIERRRFIQTVAPLAVVIDTAGSTTPHNTAQLWHLGVGLTSSRL